MTHKNTVDIKTVKPIRTHGSGGNGGNAVAGGDDSEAIGGDGGAGVLGNGGRGGDAQAIGNRSTAIGGKGGRGGIGPGMPGGDVIAIGDDTTHIGGQGGEASQPDGRGGRGGRSSGTEMILQMLGIQDRGHLKAPYGTPNLEPGRGGDSPDTPQYMARKLIVMAIKERFFLEHHLEPRDTETIWYDRQIVPLDWINQTLLLRGHRWNVSVEDGEYVFTDTEQTNDPTTSSTPKVDKGYEGESGTSRLIRLTRRVFSFFSSRSC